VILVIRARRGFSEILDPVDPTGRLRGRLRGGRTVCARRAASKHFKRAAESAMPAHLAISADASASASAWPRPQRR